MIQHNWGDIAQTTLNVRKRYGEIYAPGVVAEAAARAVVQMSESAAIDAVIETFREFLLVERFMLSWAAADEELDLPMARWADAVHRGVVSAPHPHSS